jgi:hypothetical protein
MRRHGAITEVADQKFSIAAALAYNLGNNQRNLQGFWKILPTVVAHELHATLSVQTAITLKEARR